MTPLPSIGPAPGRPDDPLVSLLKTPLSAGSAAVAVLIALGLGAAHAVSPGHGKTLVAAYVIRNRASMPQALWLGLTVAVTYTAGVFVLGVGTWFAAEWFVPERLVSWLAVVTGGLVWPSAWCSCGAHAGPRREALTPTTRGTRTGTPTSTRTTMFTGRQICASATSRHSASSAVSSRADPP